MDDHPASRTPDGPLAALRASQDRDVEREGIPMVLALVDMTGGSAPRTGEPGEGPDLAGRLAATWKDLAAHQRDDDLGAVQSVLGAVAFAEVNDGGGR